MLRRQFLPAAAAALVPHAAAQNARPNILWISCEDSSPALGCYGDPNAITPHLDRLAAEGIRYTHAFSVYGVCAPSRSSIITGMYPAALGTHHMRSQASLPPGVEAFPVYLRKAGYYCSNNVKTDYNFSAAGVWDDSSNRAHWRNRAKDQPFFAVFNFTVTHEAPTQSTGAEYAKHTAALTPAERRDPSRLRIPSFHPDTPVVRRQWANWYELMTAMDRMAGGLLAELQRDGLDKDTIVFFWSDHGTGLARGKRWVYDSGTRTPLIVRIPARFRAASQAKPGSVSSELVSLMDLGPTVLNLANVAAPAHMQGQPFLGPSLPPARKYVYAARDRMDERYDIIRSVRDSRYRYVRNYESYKPYYQLVGTAERSPVMKELRRIHALGKLPPAAAQFMAARKPAEELYDTQKDPSEVVNLASNPRHGDALRRLRREHELWMDKIGDLGLMPEGEIERQEKIAGNRRAILRDSPGRTAKWRSAAAIAELRDAQALLRDSDPVVRYWAAVWLANDSGHREKLRPLLDDECPSVRIVAARGLLRADPADSGAQAVIAANLRQGTPSTRLAAALAMEESAWRDPSLVEAATKDDNDYVRRIARHMLGQ